MDRMTQPDLTTVTFYFQYGKDLPPGLDRLKKHVWYVGSRHYSLSASNTNELIDTLILETTKGYKILRDYRHLFEDKPYINEQELAWISLQALDAGRIYHILK
jgi:hypothetical protein